MTAIEKEKIVKALAEWLAEMDCSLWRNVQLGNFLIVDADGNMSEALTLPEVVHEVERLEAEAEAEEAAEN